MMGAALLMRRDAIDAVGPADERVLHLQRGDRLLLRFRRRAGARLSTRARRSST